MFERRVASLQGDRPARSLISRSPLRLAATLLAVGGFLIGADTVPAAESVVIGNHEYRQVDGAWKLFTSQGEVFSVDPQIITVRFAPEVSLQEQTTLFQSLDTEVVRSNRLGFIDLRVAEGADVIDLALRFLDSPLVSSAEPNSIGAYLAVPNDPRYGQQWHLNQGNDADVDAPEAWDLEVGRPAIVVGVLDSGSDWTHDDMGAGDDGYQSIYLNPGEDRWTSSENPTTGNGIDDDGNGFIDDWKGWDFTNDDNDARGIFDHGTRVAGIVAAKTHNGFGVAGVAGGFGFGDGFSIPGSKVMVVGVGDTAPVTAILDDAILYAMDNGARVITMSLTVGQTAAIDAALAEAWNSGLLIDCASGNSSGAVSYPARDANVIAVGATTQSDAIAGFSCRGIDQELAAPGVSILSCVYGDGFASGDGTSFAAPIVGGVSALLFSVNPALTNVDARQILRDTADKVGGYNYNWNPGLPGHSQELGYGRVNARAAVEAAGATASIPGGSSVASSVLTLQPNVPNPFRPATHIRYTLGQPGHVTVSVQNVLGQHLTTLVDELQPAGAHGVVWDGRDELGRNAASGIYLYRVTNGSETSTGKMLLTR